MVETKARCFKTKPTDKIYGSSVLRVASQFTTVGYQDSIEDIAADFESHPQVLALGVIDEQNKFIGIIDRADFFTLLGRPFGRDILIRKQALEVTLEAPVFFQNKNVFSVAKEIESIESLKDRIHYCGLTDEDQRFAGLFSTMDLLTYLSGITQQDITLGGQLQERLVQDKQYIQGKKCSFFGFSQYAKGMGGDFYGIYPLSEEQWFFTLCDVSGKGVAASIITSMLWGMLRMYDWKRGLTALISEINKALIQTFHLEKYLTGVFGIYNAKTQEIRMADMGHSMSYLIRSGNIHHIQGPHLNLPVGIELDLQPHIAKMKVKPGDTFVFMTDGLLEQENQEGKTQEAEIWIRSLLPVLEQNEDPREGFLTLFNDFRRGIPQQDDLTALFLEIQA